MVHTQKKTKTYRWRTHLKRQRDVQNKKLCLGTIRGNDMEKGGGPKKGGCGGVPEKKKKYCLHHRKWSQCVQENNRTFGNGGEAEAVYCEKEKATTRLSCEGGGTTTSQ